MSGQEVPKTASYFLPILTWKRLERHNGMASSDEELATKAGKVELTARWVSRAWPEDIKKRPPAWGVLEKNIKEFEKYKRNSTKTKIMILLNDIDGNLDDCISQSKRLLSSYPKFRSKLEKQLQSARKLAAAQKKIAADSGGKLYTLWRMELGPPVMAKIPREFNIQLKNNHLYKLEIPEIVRHELADRNLEVVIHKEFQSLLDNFSTKCADEMKKEILASKYNGMVKKKAVKEMEKIFGKWLKFFEDAAGDIPAKVVRNSSIHEEIARRYDRERKVALAKNGVAFVGSVAAIAAPGTAALAGIAAARSGAALAKELHNFFTDIGRKLESLKKQLTYLEIAYSNAAGRVASEVTMSTLNGTLGIDVMPTLDKAQGDLEDLLKNASLSQTKLRAKHKKLNELADKAEKLNKEWLAAKKTSKFTKIDKKCQQFEKIIEKQFDIAVKSSQRLDKLQDNLPKIKKQMNQIGKNPTALKWASRGLKATANLAFSVAAVFDVASVCKDLELAIGLWGNIEGLLGDIKDETMDIVA